MNIKQVYRFTSLLTWVLIYPTDQLILFAYMDISAFLFFMNRLPASLPNPGAESCFLRAPSCFAFCHLVRGSAATFVCMLCIPCSMSVTNKRRMWHPQKKHHTIRPPLYSFVGFFFSQVLFLPVHITLPVCITTCQHSQYYKCWKMK